MTYATLGGELVSRVELHVPARGVWWADVDLVEAPDLEGAVELALGERTYQGTIDATGIFGLAQRVKLVGGGGGWGTLLTAKAYHNDAGVLGRLVAADAAREAGETLGGFDPQRASLGPDYVRQSGPASRVLEDAIGDAPWWVDFDGATQVGERAAATVDPSSYEVLEYSPRSGVVTLGVDDVGAIGIGAELTGGALDAALTVRELRVDVDAEAILVRAWTGDAPASAGGRLAAAVRRVVERTTDRRLHGIWPYRVVQMSSDRVELQAVHRELGLPDVLPVSMWPGVAGAHADLTPGAEVLVQFVAGDRTKPVVTGFSGKDGNGWTPANLTLDATTVIKLGENAANAVALANLTKARLDSIQSTFDAHIHTTTATIGVGGAGVISAPSTPIGALASVAATKVQAE